MSANNVRKTSYYERKTLIYKWSCHQTTCNQLRLRAAVRAAQLHELLLMTPFRPASHMQHDCCSSYSGPRSWKVFVGGCGTGVSGCDATLGAVSTGSCSADDDPESAAAGVRCLRPPYSACNQKQKRMDIARVIAPCGKLKAAAPKLEAWKLVDSGLHSWNIDSQCKRVQPIVNSDHAVNPAAQPRHRPVMFRPTVS